MSWFKVDDQFHSHPKVMACDPAAIGLWVVAGSWAASNLTDGRVPDYVLTRLVREETASCSGNVRLDVRSLAKQLTAAGLWKRVKGGYRFHDWADYNPTAVRQKTEREAARNRMARLRAARKNSASNQETADQSADCSGEQDANVQTNFGRSSSTPTRPDVSKETSLEHPPAEPGMDNEKRSTTRQQPHPTKANHEPRGTRIPNDFAATPDMIAWAREHTPLVGATQTEEFADYWRAIPGTKGIKIDWIATWRNWMRKAQRDAEARQARAPRTAAALPASTAPDRIPPNEMCPEHPGRRKATCGLCRASRIGARK